MTIGREVNLMKNYPYSKRDISGRLASKTDEDKRIASQFGEEFFDGDRRYGYGGYNYNPKYWTPVVPDFMKNYGLTRKSKILDVGCGRGAWLKTSKELGAEKIYGIDGKWNDGKLDFTSYDQDSIMYSDITPLRSFLDKVVTQRKSETVVATWSWSTFPRQSRPPAPSWEASGSPQARCFSALAPCRCSCFPSRPSRRSASVPRCPMCATRPARTPASLVRADCTMPAPML